MRIIDGFSHLDHELSPEHIAFIRDQFGDRSAFFIATVELPPELASLPCGLHGPLMGDAPVPESEVVRAVRGARKWPSRLCERPARPSRQITVIAGPHRGKPCVMYTAFGGPLAKQEPGDPDCADREASKVFWAEHALSI